MKFAWILVAAGLVACTKPNPAVCCLDAADCSEVGISDVRGCAAGLACVEHQCEVPSCAMAGCSAAAPVCNTTTDVCDGCTSSDECIRFADTPVCDGAGACVQCVGSMDCPTTAPVCEANACRSCRTDNECSSGACGDDGACVTESAIVYLDPGGTDAGACPRTQPCRTFGYAASQLTLTRGHIVMAQGGYNMPPTTINPSANIPRPFYIHGGGSTITEQADNPFVTLNTGSVIRHLNVNPVGTAFSLSGSDPYVIEDVSVHFGYIAFSISAPTTARDIVVDSSAEGFSVATASLKLDRATLNGPPQSLNGISGNNSTLDATNVLIHGFSKRCVDWTSGGGTLASSTLADCGSMEAMDARGAFCFNSTLTLRSTIVWTGGAGLPPYAGCNASNVIAGPIPVSGAANTDPNFVNATGGDYHLGAGSPARDAVDTGPATDFEGDPRPRGARFDIGADEAP